MKTIPVSSFPLSEPEFPVIRIDYRGRIIYANRASFPLLREWNCLANDYLPEDLIHSNPAMLDLEAAFDLQIEFRNVVYQIDVVGFKECGYIGMYGFNTEIKTAAGNEKSMLAAQL